MIRNDSSIHLARQWLGNKIKVSCEGQCVMKTVLFATVFVARRTRSPPQRESDVAVEGTPETVEMEALAVMADIGSIGSSAPSAPPVSQHVSPSASQLHWLQSPHRFPLYSSRRAATTCATTGISSKLHQRRKSVCVHALKPVAPVAFWLNQLLNFQKHFLLEYLRYLPRGFFCLEFKRKPSSRCARAHGEPITMMNVVSNGNSATTSIHCRRHSTGTRKCSSAEGVQLQQQSQGSQFQAHSFVTSSSVAQAPGAKGFRAIGVDNKDKIRTVVSHILLLDLTDAV